MAFERPLVSADVRRTKNETFPDPSFNTFWLTLDQPGDPIVRTPGLLANDSETVQRLIHPAGASAARASGVQRESPLQRSGSTKGSGCVAIGVVPAAGGHRVLDGFGLRQGAARADGGDVGAHVRRGGGSGHAPTIR